MINKKRLTKTGSICIPKFMRMEQGLSRNTALELVAKDNGDILIKKITPTCYFCGSTNDQIEVFGKTICRDCAKKIVEKTGENNE